MTTLETWSEDGSLAPLPGPTEHRHFQRTTLFLVLNTGITGASGALFWLLAARFYDEDQVGPAVAASSLLLALAFLAQLNASAAISRFLPAAGPRQRRTLLLGYRTAVLGAGLCAAGVLGVGWARGGSVISGGDSWMTAILALSLPFWVIFALQDNALASLRRSQWIPLENGLVTVAKYALLPLCAAALGGSGILLAWVLPIVIAIPAINVVLFRRSLEPGTEPVASRRAFLGFALRDMPGQVSILIAMRLVPLIVVEQLGTHVGALIGLPWSILTVAALALPTLSLSLLAELSREGADARALRRRSTLLVVGVLFPATVMAALLAHPVLALAGGAYASHGASVLAWGALGLAPGALVETRLAVFRAEGRVVSASIVQVLRSVALLGAVTVLIDRGDVEQLGMAFLVVNVTSVLVVLLVARLLRVGWDPIDVDDALVPTAAATLTARERRALAAPLRRRKRRRSLAVLRWLLPLVGVALGLAGALRANPGAIDEIGLLRTLPLVYFAGLALVLVNVAVPFPDQRWSARFWAPVNLVALAFLLHGLPGVVEPNARFSVAWLHIGFVDEIARRGQLLGIDARFSWAGFFSGNALLQRTAATDSLLWLLRFTPVAISLFACWGTGLLGRIVGIPRHRRLLAMVLFLLVNWTGQDYFSPQGATFCIALALVVATLAIFSSDPHTYSPRAARLLGAARQPHVELPRVTRVLAYLGIVTAFVALAVSHQLSPLFLAVVLLGLGFLGAIRTRWIGAAAAVVTMAWISFGATAYWKGHLPKITGTFGRVGTVVDSNVGNRTHGNSLGRTLAVTSRIGVAAVVWLVALIALWALRRRGRLPVPLLCLLVAPMPLFVAQSYGGEMLIRVYLFSLPAATLLVAHVLDHRRLHRLAGRVAVGLLLAALVPVFVLGRFGNERYEQVTTGDQAILSATYAAAPAGTIVYLPNRQTIMYAQRVDEVRFRQLRSVDPDEIVGQLRQETTKKRPGFVLLTASQAAFGEQVRHLPPGWLDELRHNLLQTGRFEVVARAGPATLLAFQRDPS